MQIFGFALVTGTETLKKLRTFFQNAIHLHPWHPKQQRAVNSLRAII